VGAIGGLALGEALNTYVVDQLIEPRLTERLTSTTIRIGQVPPDISSFKRRGSPFYRFGRSEQNPLKLNPALQFLRPVSTNGV
jgi:hypothetical protein